ncbi:hypothetical protein V6N13_148167 [Hibiscus sabdariffa]
MRKYRKAKKSNVKLNLTIDQEVATMRRIIRCIVDPNLNLYILLRLLKTTSCILKGRKNWEMIQHKEKSRSEEKDFFNPFKNSFNWQQGCEIADNWSLEHFASTTRAVDKAAPDGEIAVVREVMGCIAHHKLESPYEPNDLEDYIKQQEKQKADRNNAARKEKQKTGRKKKKTPEASPTTSSTANSTNILSPLQLLESFNQN